MPHNSLTDGLADLPRSTNETRDANLVRATTDLYVQDALHDREQSRRFEELAVHLLPRIGIADRAYVSERLADRQDVPAAVIRMLARDVIDVAAPILSGSRLLDTLTLLSTIATTGAEHHRIIARRKELPEQVKRALRLTGDAEVLRLVDGETSATPGGGPLAEPVSLGDFRHGPGTLRDVHRDGRKFLELSRRERLAILVDYATRPPTPTPNSTASRLDRAFRSILGAAKIVGFARAGQRDELVAAIADGLDLARDFVGGCLGDPTGEALAILLKALRLDSIQAQQVFLLATPSGQDTSLFFPLADLYAGMEASVAETMADSWRANASGQRATYVPYVAGEAQSRAAAATQATRVTPPLAKPDDAKRA